MNFEILKKFKKIFYRKKKIKSIDFTRCKDVSKHIESSFTRMLIPKDDDDIGSFTDFSEIGP